MNDKYREEELTAYAIGELDETRTLEIEQLLQSDASASQTVDEIRATARVLTDALAVESAPRLTESQRRVIEAGMRRTARRLWIPLAAAASILILLGAAFLAAQSGLFAPRTDKPAVVDAKGEHQSPNNNKHDEKVRLEIEYPKAKFEGTPGVVDEPNIAPPSFDPPDPLYVPRGTVNLAFGAQVTSNAPVAAGRLKMVTDGDKSGDDGHYLDIGDGRKWVQIDLGADANVYAIAMWHYYDYGQARAYRDVIVRISSDADFSKYTTVFNSDHDNSSKLGAGGHMGYVETTMGKLLDCKGAVGRYVRLYSRGNTTDDQNHYIEVEVHGKKVDAREQSKATTASGPLPTPTAAPSARPAAKSRARREDKVRLRIKYPKPLFDGTPVPVNEPNICRPTGKPPRSPVVPSGTVNLALKKPVTSNETQPVVGELEMVTDGHKDGEDGHDVDIGIGIRWVQIDLESPADIHVIAVWHYHRQARAYRDVVVHVSNDPDFIKYTTVFNSDHDNSSGFGIGDNMGYVETCHGKLIMCSKTVGRYVRLYSNGNTSSDNNHYIEVEVYGKKLKGPAPTTRPAKWPTTRPASAKSAKGIRQSGLMRAKSSKGGDEKVSLRIKLPKPMFKCTPVTINEPNVAKLSWKPRRPPLVPIGTVNLALNKPVSSNEPLPVVGDLEMVTDGDKSGGDGHNVDIGLGLKWVQIDLETPAGIHVIAVWHYHGQARAYRDVVVRVSNDPDFIEYDTVFNSDHDHSSGLGIGQNMGYVETNRGKLIRCWGTVGRYVRLYSNGNTSNDQNHYVEVEVYGQAPITRPARIPAPQAPACGDQKVPLKIKCPTPIFH